MKKTKKVYISGQISGLEREVYMSRFSRFEQMLKDRGYMVVNPTRVWVCRWERLWKFLAGRTSEHTIYALTLLYDLWLMMRCDLIYKIPGWRESHGANIESCVAYHLKIWQLPTKQRETIDKKMAKMIDRQNAKINAA